MHITTTRLFTALLVGLLFLQSVVSIFVYDIRLHSIRRKFKWEILNSLQPSQLTLVKVAKVLEQSPNLQFKRMHGKEFRFLDEMYDVVSQKEFKDTTYYYCFKDDDESEIIRNINRWMKDNFASPKENNEKEDVEKDFFEKDYLATSGLKCYPVTTVTNISSVKVSVLHIGFLKSFSPPPEIAA